MRHPAHLGTAAIAANKPGRAMTISPVTWCTRRRGSLTPGGALVSVMPRYRRRLTSRQVFDVKTIHDLGPRLDVYAGITAPVLLLQGERSPAHLGERIRSLARVLPDDEVVEFDGQGHAGNKRAPDKLAVLVADFYDRIVSDSR